jgi:formylglycine-generating enzyme required for sulfatase activity
MIEWIPVPGGEVLLGLSADEARTLARAAAKRARAMVSADPDPLRADREARELEDKWGNVEYLCEQLAFSMPAHLVELAPFSVTKQPVTHGDWRAFAAATKAPAPAGWSGDGAADDTALVGVSWEEANAYASWRGAKLPTEAQWELAARGPKRTALAWGNDWLGEAAQVGGVIRAFGELHEWCVDEFAPYPGADQLACDRIAPPPGGWWGTRTRRGGALPGIPHTTVMRRGADPDVRLRDTTFRLVKTT